MMWATSYPAKRMYEFFMSRGYNDFDDVLKYTRLMLSGERKLVPGDSFFDKENQVFVVKNLENDRFLCVLGIYDKKLQMFAYSQSVLDMDGIRNRCALDGSIQLMYYRVDTQAMEQIIGKAQ